ncbi:MAG: HPr family phosphocarrier protein [Candidatus Limnocylindrales bacterium]|jgi:phosphotransferase system HPr (HPr) family protein
MRTIDLEIRNPTGLHARPAALFVKTAAGFGSRIALENVTRGTAPGNAKSIMTVLSSGVARGHVIRLSIEGEDEEAAARTLSELVAGGLGEAIE